MLPGTGSDDRFVRSVFARALAAVGIDLIEFPADDLPRAQRFWEGLLDLSLAVRTPTEGLRSTTSPVSSSTSCWRTRLPVSELIWLSRMRFVSVVAGVR